MGRSVLASIKYSWRLHIRFTPDVSGRCCHNIIHRRGRYIIISAGGVNQQNSWVFCAALWRLCRNYERYLSPARAMTYLAAILFMLRYFWPSPTLCHKIWRDKSYIRLGHSLALFFSSFGHDGTPSLPHDLKKITQRLTALPLTFIVEPALNHCSNPIVNLWAKFKENGCGFRFYV